MSQQSRNRRIFPLLLSMFCMAGVSSAAQDAPIRVLLLSGQNNHNWRETTPVLKRLCEDTGRFKVDICEQPEKLTAETLRPYSVIVSNWNSFSSDPRNPMAAWPEKTREAYLDFVRNGKGHVVIHAGSSSFYEWPEYQKLILATWGMDVTGHGAPHDFPVSISDPDHPVTRGLEGFETFDELWHKVPLQPGVTVLAKAFSSEKSGGTGKEEPVALAASYGKGRSFTLLLGHDARAMRSPGFAALLTRGTEWAATGNVTLAVSAPPSAGAQAGLKWKQTESFLALLNNERTVWQFNHAKDLEKTYFDPLGLLDGRNLAWNAPPDHVWHHGLWFSWKFINGVNYWEINGDTGKPDGETKVETVKATPKPDHSARIEMTLSYAPQGGQPVMTEKRKILISPPDAKGSYHLDWTLTFQAGTKDVVLDRTPLPGEPGGQSWGGYAGLSMRFAKDFKDWQVMSTEGRIQSQEANRYRGKAPALDFSGALDGDPAGIAILDHPANLNAPTPWYVIMDPGPSFAYFTPAVICYGPHTLRGGKSMALRYRVIVHPGRYDAAALKAESARFTNPPGNRKSGE